MYSYIKGTLAEIGEDLIVVENNGIGYNISVPGQVLDYLPSVGEEIKIYTYTYVREEALGLFGFLTRDDLNVFRLLLTVSGIGPKGALSVLSVLSADDLRFAVVGDDVKAIEKVPGIGKKTAQRVIIELKDKMSLEEAFENKLSQAAAPGAEKGTGISGIKNEAVQALTALGYSSSEALKALQNVEITETMTVEDVLKNALKQMAFM